MLKEAIEKSRGLSHELSPAVLHHADFVETLGWLAKQMQAKHGLVVHVRAKGPASLQSDAVKGFLYRAVQELLFNVAKHARVNEARIRLRRCGPCVCLSVSDRGRGFDPQELQEAAGYGLLSIRERVELLGRSHEDQGAKGKGSSSMSWCRIANQWSGCLRSETSEGGRRECRRPIPVPTTEHPAGALADDHGIVREGLRSLLREDRMSKSWARRPTVARPWN